MTLRKLYRDSLALLTDLYQLTMAYAYWKSGYADRLAAFYLYFRTAPFRGNTTLFSGLATIMGLLEDYQFREDDLRYLAGLKDGREDPLFSSDFLEYLKDLRLSCDLYSVPEGTAVFPNQPLLRIEGPIIQCQLLETALLNIVNFQSLIATKAARVVAAAEGDPVLEFGLRRAQGIDGSLSASWAAYLGGCTATSNVLAGKLYGIPVKGTHAHSWVMAFENELEAFEAYAAAMPNNCVFLVDTYETLEGVRNAIEVGRKLRRKGRHFMGIRLDSGDLARLSVAAREMLDAAGFADTVIVGSNDLDETAIAELKRKGAPIGMWGVGTKLATAYDQPALGGVYKLSAIRRENEPWHYRLKVSDDPTKTSNPGILQVRRFQSDDRFLGDMIFDEVLGMGGDPEMVDINTHGKWKPLPGSGSSDLLRPILKNGRAVCPPPSLPAARDYARNQWTAFSNRNGESGSRDCYPVGLETRLQSLKRRMVRESKAGRNKERGPVAEKGALAPAGNEEGWVPYPERHLDA